jgi:hypothetical protein
METRSKTRRSQPRKPALLNLGDLGIYKDLRKLVYDKLTEYDRQLVLLALDTAASSHYLYNDMWFRLSCVANGYLSLLKHASERITKQFPNDWANVAAKNGHIHMLEWLHENGCDLYYAAGHAASCDKLHVIKWLRDKDASWTHNVCFGAALGGHLSLLQWAREHGYDWDRSATSVASYNGHLSLLRWAVENGCPINVDNCLARSRKPEITAYLKTLRG